MSAAVWVTVSVRQLRRTDASVRAALGLVHVELDRRYQYIPGLVLAAAETVGRELVNTVSGARSLAMRIREEDLDPRRQAGAENALSEALQSLLATANRYPALRNDWAFTRPSHEIEQTEARLAGAIQVYNDMAGRLDRSLTTFPTGLIARRIGIVGAQPFEATILEVPTSGTKDADAGDDGVADVAA
ncbi:LemA family protein [Rhodococcus sp. TAF43]|uniref:LemA family protein n=1 Tax=unclassified Rhodococcus (in: high G+C Gram-positive bacteria) TaxID=192944 RepID=UPI0020C68D2C|nr:LemA family protein [Rhodococcus sp. W8901]